MTFDFINNAFINAGMAGDDAFITGTDETLSYRQVYERHLALKAQIVELGIPPGHPVCIYGEKEAFFPVAIITLISLDIPYIPIDVIMPPDRIRSIQQQSQSRVLINCTGKKCGAGFDIEIPERGEILITGKPAPFHAPYDPADPLRYILFTSGSTGQPKGVQITASSLNSFVAWYARWPVISPGCVFMNQAPFSFDVSLCDVVGGFALGCPVILNNYAILKNGHLFLERLGQYKANTIVCTPSFIKMYLSVPDFNAGNFPALERFIFMAKSSPLLLQENCRPRSRPQRS